MKIDSCKQFEFVVMLSTSSSDVLGKLLVACYEEQPAVTLQCIFAGKEYIGKGIDYCWNDAFADLQRKLPAGVALKCCLTCRHGNLCPAGNEINEVFCTKDVLITGKSDLYFYTEDESERGKRARQYCDFCEDFQPQSESYDTYNDYLHYLNKA